MPQALASLHCALLVQPQAPATHAGPGEHALEQVAHAPLLVPHSSSSVPVTQVLPAQHPPWQGLCAEHIVLHTEPKLVGVHAVPAGQSFAVWACRGFVDTRNRSA
jgi:hypothetical protein